MRRSRALTDELQTLQADFERERQRIHARALQAILTSMLPAAVDAHLRCGDQAAPTLTIGGGGKATLTTSTPVLRRLDN
ncbi:MAG: hypothetical protein IPH35_18745 [Rhodoferax sp.]|nr:hypothetical protein [Rhodoferax sp.]